MIILKAADERRSVEVPILCVDGVHEADSVIYTRTVKGGVKREE